MGKACRALLAVLVVVLPLTAEAAEQLAVFEAQLLFVNPNPELWLKEAERQDSTKGLFVLKHTGVTDQHGKVVQPVLAIVYERLPPFVKTLADYVGMARDRTPFSTDRIVQENHRIIFHSRYDREAPHTLVIAHFIFQGIGVQVMGDAIESVYGHVETDIRQFIDSIRLR